MMRARLLLLAAACASLFATPQPAGARELRGSVQILAKGGKFIDKSADPRTAVVIYRPRTPVRNLQTSRTFTMTTRKKEFLPRVLAVPVGATVQFPNEDPILHNVFSVSGENRFDLGLYRQGKGKSATFRTPGIVRVFCNVHHGMFGYIFVVASPYWARVGADGTFRIPDVPAGPGQLTVWNERSSPTTRELTLPVAPPYRIGIEITMPRIPPHKNKLGNPYSGGGYG